ncbi:hypothetical protein AB1Y20_009046 [Prymnesium parvum]|uniref:EF-hand domain-containing protein n=1 Tax=Prymnesium parvum TaxID=97485 RepID=A0AB34K0Y9_PRYPA
MKRMLGAISEASSYDVFKNPIARPEWRKYQTTLPPIAPQKPVEARKAQINCGDAKLKAKIHAMGLHRRANPRQRKQAEIALCKMQVDDWMYARRLIRKIDVSPSQRQALREVFDMIDSDHGGTIDLEEMSVIMSAQCFKPSEIKEAMRIGDCNGDGELDFEEFVTLVGTIGAGRSPSDTTAHVAGEAGNTFPFSLVANGYRIKQLIDRFDPAVREAGVVKVAKANHQCSLPSIPSSERPLSPVSDPAYPSRG